MIVIAPHSPLAHTFAKYMKLPKLLVKCVLKKALVKCVLKKVQKAQRRHVLSTMNRSLCFDTKYMIVELSVNLTQTKTEA